VAKACNGTVLERLTHSTKTVCRLKIKVYVYDVKRLLEEPFFMLNLIWGPFWF
jgi:hypothetical protein